MLLPACFPSSREAKKWSRKSVHKQLKCVPVSYGSQLSLYHLVIFFNYHIVFVLSSVKMSSAVSIFIGLLLSFPPKLFLISFVKRQQQEVTLEEIYHLGIGNSLCFQLRNWTFLMMSCWSIWRMAEWVRVCRGTVWRICVLYPSYFFRFCFFFTIDYTIWIGHFSIVAVFFCWLITLYWVAIAAVI